MASRKKILFLFRNNYSGIELLFSLDSFRFIYAAKLRRFASNQLNEMEIFQRIEFKVENKKKKLHSLKCLNNGFCCHTK